MVWEQRSRGVVMLNRVVEKGSVSPVVVDVVVVDVADYSVRCSVFKPSLVFR